jgi:acetyltransferase-like isoleucine patch superfamily enzyme
MTRRILFAFLKLLVRLAELLYQGEGVSTLMLILPTQLIARVMREYGAEIGEEVRFRSPLILHNAAEDRGRDYFANLCVGDKSYFGKDVFLDLKDKIVVEERVTVAMRATILTHTDVGNSPLAEGAIPVTQAPVMIRAGAYIGAGAMLLQGVEIGERAVIGAGAVVTGSIPADSIAVGVPARVVKKVTIPGQALQFAER